MCRYPGIFPGSQSCSMVTPAQPRRPPTRTFLTAEQLQQHLTLGDRARGYARRRHRNATRRDRQSQSWGRDRELSVLRSTAQHECGAARPRCTEARAGQKRGREDVGASAASTKLIQGALIAFGPFWHALFPGFRGETGRLPLSSGTSNINALWWGRENRRRQIFRRMSLYGLTAHDLAPHRPHGEGVP
jgi:hypothetical protein